MQCLAFDFAVGTRHSAAALGVVGAVYLFDFSVTAFLATGAKHDVCIFQAHFLAGRHAHKFLFRFLLEVLTLNPQFATKGNAVCVALHDGISLFVSNFRVVDCRKCFLLSLGIIRDNYLHGVQHGADTCGTQIQVLTHGAFEQRHFV